MVAEKKSHRLSIAVAGVIATVLFIGTLLVGSSARGHLYVGQFGSRHGGKPGCRRLRRLEHQHRQLVERLDQRRSGMEQRHGRYGRVRRDTGANPYTVTLAQATSAAGIIFQSQNYTLADGGNTFTLTNPSASFTTPDISIAPGVAGVLRELYQVGGGGLRQRRRHADPERLGLLRLVAFCRQRHIASRQRRECLGQIRQSVAGS